MKRKIRNRVSGHGYLVRAILTLGSALCALAPPSLNAAQDDLSQKEFSREVDAFYAAVLDARAKALQTGQAVSVKLDPVGWLTYNDKGLTRWQKDAQDEIVLSGTWKEGIKLGTNLPDGQVLFEKDGTCHISSDAVCVEDDWKHPERVGHVVAIASRSARRIYTLFFDHAGKPLIEYNDF